MSDLTQPIPEQPRQGLKDSLRQTMFEPPAEMRQAELPVSRPLRSDPAEVGHASPTAAADTVPYRPTRRPPMAVLQAFDDGQKTGESVRIRSASFVIGRTEGDLVIPHDPQMSSRHAEITRRLVDGRHLWYLRDLQSTNGTFVRVKDAILEDRAEIILGRQRLRFEASALKNGPGDTAAPGDIRETWDWRTAKQSLPAHVGPSLVELFSTGEGRRMALDREQHWIGRDPRLSSPVLPEDPTVNPRHARIFRDGQGRWHVEDAASLNGVWIRVTSVPLGSGGVFLLGEQLFAIVFP